MEPDERLIREMVVASLGKCASCSRPFDADSVTILGHQDNLWFLMLICKECSTHGLVAALLKDNQNLATVEPVSEELLDVWDSSPVTADDVLDVHEFLKDFDGDFERLFGQPRGEGFS